MLTASGTQAIDLICRLLLKPGDTVLVDDPCYFNFRALLRAHQVRIVGVPYTPTGPDMAAFEASLTAERPRLYITNSALHNPTGATLSPQAAHRLLSAASAHDLTIIEDDIFADFEPEPSSRLAVLDGLNRVIRIGSFSKTLSASDPLRLHRCTCGLDRRPGRSPSRHVLRRTEPGRDRADRQRSRRRRLPQAHGRIAPAPHAGADARWFPGWSRLASDLGYCRAAAFIFGAACPTARIPRRSLVWPWRRTSCLPRAMCSALRRRPLPSCASTSPNRTTRVLLPCLGRPWLPIGASDFSHRRSAPAIRPR